MSGRRNRVYVVGIPRVCQILSTFQIKSCLGDRNVLQCIPFEQDLVCFDVDLVEQRVNDPHIGSTSSQMASVCLGEIDSRDQHSILGRDVVLVTIDVRFKLFATGSLEVVVQGDCEDLLI